MHIFKGCMSQNEITLSAWRELWLWVTLRTKLTLLMHWDETNGLEQIDRRVQPVSSQVEGRNTYSMNWTLSYFSRQSLATCHNETKQWIEVAQLVLSGAHGAYSRWDPLGHVLDMFTPSCPLLGSLTHSLAFYCRQPTFPVHKRKPTKGIWSLKACVERETIGMSFRRSMLNWLSR